MTAIQKTSVSILQELMQRNKKSVPIYSLSDVANTNGDFVCVVKVDSVETLGYGKTKKEAKHNSAQNAIVILQQNGNNLIKTTDVMIAPKVVPLAKLPTDNYVGALNEFCSKNSLSYPEYEEKGFDGQYFNIICSLAGVMAVGKGINKKIAKQEAARVVLEKVKSCDSWKNKSTTDTLSKLVYDETDIKKITQIYKNLSLLEKKYIPSDINIAAEIDFSTCNLKQLKDTEVFPLEQEEYPPIETSEEKLTILGIANYSISIFAREPLMLIFKAQDIIPGMFTLIQDGATYSEAKTILLATAAKFIDILKN